MDNKKQNQKLTRIRERVENTLDKIPDEIRRQMIHNGEILSHYARYLEGGVNEAAALLGVNENTWVAMQIGSNSPHSKMLEVSHTIKDNIGRKKADRMMAEEVINELGEDKSKIISLVDSLSFFLEHGRLPEL